MCFELSDEGINWLDDRGNDLNESQLCGVVASNICEMRCYILIVFELIPPAPRKRIGVSMSKSIVLDILDILRRLSGTRQRK